MAKPLRRDAPPHFSALWLGNFRGFRKTDRIPLAPLTFIVGPNSSGKSSLFDALLLIAQSGFWPDNFENVLPNWSGPLVDLGSFNDAVYRHNNRLAIKVGFEISSVGPISRRASTRKKRQLAYPMRLEFEMRTGKQDPIGRLRRILVADSHTGEEVQLRFRSNLVKITVSGRDFEWEVATRTAMNFEAWLSRVVGQARKALPAKPVGRKSALRRILSSITSLDLRIFLLSAQRVSSGRAGPKRWYPVTDLQAQDFRRMFLTPGLVDTVDPSMIDESSREGFFFGRRRAKPRTSLREVLRQLDIADEVEDSTLSAYHHAIVLTDSITGVRSNLIDVGYGTSQVIPVIHAALTNSPGPLLVEQPEIHLHPKAQGTVSQLLCDTSKERQVIVETHSVHLVNRARILVAQGDLRPDHVVVNYVSRQADGSLVTTIGIGSDGEFTDVWPEGFFDERYQDTLQLLSLRSEGN